MPPITSINDDDGHKLTAFVENKIQYTHIRIAEVLLIVFIIIHVIIHTERLVHIFIRLYLPKSVYSTPNDVLSSLINELDYPLVAVQLPMINEIECCESIIDCACNLDWPKSRLIIQVVDDSSDEQAKTLVDNCVQKWNDRGVQINVCRRRHRQGFKAGALNTGMSFIRHAEYIVLFDADFLPTKDFLRRTLPILIYDSTIAFVQARWTFTNAKESFLTRMQEIILNFHHKCEQEGRFRASLFFTFNGTGGVWRASAIEQAGGWPTDTLVEDLDLSVRVYLNGWRAVYVQDVECLNELPSTLSTYLSQQHRWTCGPTQVARKMVGLVCQAKHISWLRKLICLCYLFRHFIHLFNVISLILITPVSMWTPQWNLYNTISIYVLVIHSFCVVIFTRNAVHLTLLYILFLNTMSLHNACASISGLFNYGLAKQWIVTQKSGNPNYDIFSMRKSTEKVLSESNRNENILMISEGTVRKKSCLFCITFCASLVTDPFHRICRRLCQKLCFTRIYKRKLFMAIYLFVIAYAAFKKEFYTTSIYLFSTAIMYVILAFSLIGRRN